MLVSTGIFSCTAIGLALAAGLLTMYRKDGRFRGLKLALRLQPSIIHVDKIVPPNTYASLGWHRSSPLLHCQLLHKQQSRYPKAQW